MASSAISSILDSRDDAKTHAETGIGAYINNGDVASFHEWEFRIRSYIAGKTGDEKIEAMSFVCAGLRGDAIIAAQEAGFDNVREIIDETPCGIEALTSYMRETVFPRLNTSLKDYSASIGVQKDSYPEKCGKYGNSVSRGDDVVGHP